MLQCRELNSCLILYYWLAVQARRGIRNPNEREGFLVLFFPRPEMESDFPHTDQGKTQPRVSYFFDHDVGNVRLYP